MADYHSMKRKQLQTLCKKYKIPANRSNVAMADALTAYHSVDISGSGSGSRTNNAYGGEDPPACRICFIEFAEGGGMKLECRCKGDLALAHQKCVIKWFNIQGSTTCYICKQDIQNLQRVITNSGVVSIRVKRAESAASKTKKQAEAASKTSDSEARWVLHLSLVVLVIFSVVVILIL